MASARTSGRAGASTSSWRRAPCVVRRLEVLASSAEPPLLKVAIDVGKGYYVRALARDLAGALGTVGHLTALRRTCSGCFAVDEARARRAARSAAAAVDPLAQAAARRSRSRG